MRKLSERSKDIDFSDLGAAAPLSIDAASEIPASSVPPTAEAPREPRTAIGVLSRSIGINREMEEELRATKAKLQKYKGVPVVIMLDPAQVRLGRYAMRVEQSFLTQAFAKLKTDIAAAGGNVEPIKVRSIKNSPDNYEIVFGHRRHRACLELGIRVASIVEEVDDATAFLQMQQENMRRQPLTPFERGVRYKSALDNGVFRSLRELAATLGLAESTVTSAIVLASLPEHVLAAFKSPLELQMRWSSALARAIDEDPKRVARIAARHAGAANRASARSIFEDLTGLTELGRVVD